MMVMQSNRMRDTPCSSILSPELSRRSLVRQGWGSIQASRRLPSERGGASSSVI